MSTWTQVYPTNRSTQTLQMCSLHGNFSFPRTIPSPSRWWFSTIYNGLITAAPPSLPSSNWWGRWRGHSTKPKGQLWSCASESCGMNRAWSQNRAATCIHVMDKSWDNIAKVCRIYKLHTNECLYCMHESAGYSLYMIVGQCDGGRKVGDCW